MIRNERQYRITKSQAEGFRKAQEQLQSSTVADTRTPAYLRWKIQLDAVSSQLDELTEEIREYEALRSETNPPIEISSLDELSKVLIQGRIAAGLTQKELAAKLGLKEQQIQRYEATDYQSASLQRIREIVKALGLMIRQEVFLPTEPVTGESLIGKLSDLGLDKDFIVDKVIPERLRSAMERRAPQENLAAQWASSLAKIFELDIRSLFAAGPLQLNQSAVLTARFKLPANFSRTKFTAYTVYAHYLALLALQATPDLFSSQIPASWKHVRRQILAKYGELNLTSIVGYCWDLGIPVLALSDPGIFHGATWRVQYRNVIVVKQRTKSEARWMTDILHELWHAAQNSELSDASAVEIDPRSENFSQSIDEEIATDFAADVLLNGRAEELAEECAKVCKLRTEWLKNAVQTVAQRNGVREDVLANYLAYRLNAEGEDWWATATTMQRTRDDLMKVIRDPILLRSDWSRLSPPDRETLQRSLQ